VETIAQRPVVEELARPRAPVAALRVRVSTGIVPYLFILPKLVFFAVFMLLPLLWTVLMTFQSGAILKGQRFVGLENYAKIVEDELFWLGLRNSFYYTVIVIPSVIVIGISLGALLNRQIRFRPLFILLLIMPTVTSTVAASVIWGYLLHTDVGLFNTVLHYLGRKPVNWLGTPDLVMPIFVALELWRGAGFYAILFLAAMQSIPQHLYDAAAIDGATGLQAFRLVTLPLMRPVILFATVMATIWNLQIFDSPYVMTKGGPGYASMTVVMYIYRMAFKFDEMGVAATMAFILLVIIMLLAVLQLTLFRKEIQF
jgi:ABC-type sugar transport system permease subunit